MSQPPDPNTKLGSWEGHAFRPFSQIQKITQNLHNTQLNEKKQQQQQQQPSAPIAVKSNDHGREHQILKKLTIRIIDTYSRVNSRFYYSPSLNPRRVLTKPSERVCNNGYDNKEHNYILYVNDVIASLRNRYRVIDLLGQGSFGQVVKCLDETSGEYVAVKIIKSLPAYHNQGLVEVKILQLINSHFDTDRYPMVRLLDSFVFRRHLCLVFELLSISLYDLIRQNQFKGLSLKLIALFVRQLLIALEALAELQVMHCDLKPENILLEDISSPNLKLIDFGSACFEYQAVYSYIQSRFYRSPEVLLGLPYRLPIDMWSLGCVSFELFVGLPLFPGQNEHRMLARIIKAFGMPPYHMLAEGRQTLKFFNKVANEGKSTDYELKSDWAYAQENNLPSIPPNREYFKSDKMEEIIMNYEYKPGLTSDEIEAERYQRRMFIHLLQGMLRWDPDLRWTPSQALRHPFFTGAPWSPDFEPPPDRALSPSLSLPHVRYALPTQQSSSATTQQLANSPSVSLQPTGAVYSARRNSRSDADDNYRQHRNKRRSNPHHHRAGCNNSSSSSASFTTATATLSSSPSSTSMTSVSTNSTSTKVPPSTLRHRSLYPERSFFSSNKPPLPSSHTLPHTSAIPLSSSSSSSSTLMQSPHSGNSSTKWNTKGPPRIKRSVQNDGKRRRANSSPPLTPTETTHPTVPTHTLSGDHTTQQYHSHHIHHSNPPKFTNPPHSHVHYYKIPKNQIPYNSQHNTQYLSKSWETNTERNYFQSSNSSSKTLSLQHAQSDRALNLLPQPTTSTDDRQKNSTHNKDNSEEDVNDNEDNTLLPSLPPLSEETVPSSPPPPPTELMTSGQEQELDELLPPWPWDGTSTEPSPRDLTNTSDPSPRESHGSSSFDPHDWDPTYSDDQLLQTTSSIPTITQNSAELMTMFSPPERDSEMDLSRTLTQLSIRDTDNTNTSKHSGRIFKQKNTSQHSTPYSHMGNSNNSGGGGGGGYTGLPLTTLMTTIPLYNTATYSTSISFLSASPYEHSLYAYLPPLPSYYSHPPHPPPSHSHHYPLQSSRSRVSLDQQSSFYSVGFGSNPTHSRFYHSSHPPSSSSSSSSSATTTTTTTMSRSSRNSTQYYSSLTNTNTFSGNHRYGQQSQQSLQTSHVYTTQRKSSNLPPQTS